MTLKLLSEWDPQTFEWEVKYLDSGLRKRQKKKNSIHLSNYNLIAHGLYINAVPQIQITILQMQLKVCYSALSSKASISNDIGEHFGPEAYF